MMRFANLLRATNNIERPMLQCLQTGFQQRLVTGLHSYSPYAILTRAKEEQSKIGSTQARGRPKAVWRNPVSTFNQHKLLRSDHIDVSNFARPIVKLNDSEQHTWQMSYRELRGERVQFPSNSRGFLYFHQPQGAPLLAGELRFRLTPSDLPKSFSQGEDCMTPEGDVWKIPLFVLHSFPYHRHIYQRLRKDGLVSDALHLKLADVLKTCLCPRNTSVILHSLDQVFPVNFAVRSLRFFIVGDSSCRMVDVRFPFEMQVVRHEKGTPFTSKGLVRFELSRLPEHEGSRVLVMRVVKLLGDLGSYLGEDRPVERALVLRHNPAGGEPKVFCLNIDRDTPDHRTKGFSHPDAFPLLLRSSLGDESSRP